MYSYDREYWCLEPCQTVIGPVETEMIDALMPNAQPLPLNLSTKYPPKAADRSLRHSTVKPSSDAPLTW